MRRRRPQSAAHKKVLKSFDSYVRKNKIKHQPIITRIEAFLGGEMRRTILRQGKLVPLKYSSIRTTAGSLVGALQLQKNVRLNTPRIRELFRWLQKEMKKSTLKKATPITPGQIRQLAGFTEMEYTILLCATVTCQRMATMKSIKHVHLHPDLSWELVFNHKTEAAGIAGHIKVPIDRLPTLVAYARQMRRHQVLFCSKSIDKLLYKLRKKKLGLHSFRRGGILHWYKKGVALSIIRQWTLHTTDASLLNYLDTKTITVIQER
jgi:hypothetical protein